MPRHVTVGWMDPETEIDYRVTLSVTPGDPGRTWGPPEKCYPPEGPEIEVLSVREDRPGGAERPDLVDRAEKALALDPGEVLDRLEDDSERWEDED